MSILLEINEFEVSFETNIADEIDPVVNVDCSMKYSDFFENFLVKNRPCVFHADITKVWPCRRNWSLNEAPNFEFLKELFSEIF